jgi:hypothetical protein
MSTNAKPAAVASAANAPSGGDWIKWLFSSIGDGLKALFTGQLALVLTIGITMAAFGWSFYNFASFVGSKDDWNTLKPQVLWVMGQTAIGIIFLSIASLIYFTQNSEKAVYFILVVSCIALGLSYAALAIASISR